MQKKINWLPVFAVVMTLFCLGFMLHDVYESSDEVIPEGYISQSELESAVNAKALEVTEEKAAEISELASQLATKTTEVAEEIVEEVKESLGYLIDEIFFGDEVSNELSDRELSTLFDGEVEFDGDDYEAEEIFSISKMNILSNEEDFEGVSYLVIPEDSIEYNMYFESGLDVSQIEEDETLVFNFLGKEVEVSKWTSSEITFSMGTTHYMDQGTSVDIDGVLVTLNSVYDEKVYVTVGDETKKIEEGETGKFNELEVFVKEVDFQAYAEGYKQATLVIGKDVTETIETGDEFAEDSIWEYVVTSNSLGLILKEEFMELDDDYKPLALDEKLCLPNDYVCVKFSGVLEEDSEELNFELDTKNLVDYVEVNGNFQSGLDDFDRLYIKRSDGTIYDEDLELITGDITVLDFDSTFSVVGGNIVIKDFEVNLALDNSNVGDDDVDFMTDFGIFVSNPEDSSEDQEWTITVPEYQLESSLTVM